MTRVRSRGFVGYGASLSASSPRTPFLYVSVHADARGLAKAMSVLIMQPQMRTSAPPEIRIPTGVVGGSYRASVPLIRRSRLTSRDNGGVGKQLSDGWCLNFAVGCTHACPFCYVDEIHKRFGRSRYGEAVLQRWGDYMLIPENLDEARDRTPWERSEGM